jgi:hypothetical protein
MYEQTNHSTYPDQIWWDAWRGYMYDNWKTSRDNGMVWYNPEPPELHQLEHYKWIDQALGNLKAAKAAQPVAEALRDQDAWVREEAIVALAKIGEPGVQPLVTAMKDKSESVRRDAAEALAKSEGPSSPARTVNASPVVIMNSL